MDASLQNDSFRVYFSNIDSSFGHQFQIRETSKWRSLLSSFSGFDALIFNSQEKNISYPLKLITQSANELILEASNQQISIQMILTQENNMKFHIQYRIQAKEEIELIKLGVFYKILLGDTPDFTWVPHLRPQKAFVIGDHVFRSPVLLYMKGEYAIGMIPDLNLLSKYRMIPTYLDFNLRNTEFEPFPILSYAFGQYTPEQHLYFKLQRKTPWILAKNSSLILGYHLLFFTRVSSAQLLDNITHFLWTTFSSAEVHHSLNPQILPYDNNVQEGYDAIFRRHKCWGDFTMNSILCGGIWQKTYVGEEKQPYMYINQLTHDKLIDPNESLLTLYQRKAVIWNNAWFLNIRTAYGLAFFGKKWNNIDLNEKSQRIFNTLLNLPRIRGLFPSIIFPSLNNEKEIYTINGVKAFYPTSEYNVVDACIAMYWALKISIDLDMHHPSLLPLSQDLAQFICDIQMSNGAIPVFVGFSLDMQETKISNELLNSASSGAPLMFLTELSKITPKDRYLNCCLNITKYLESEILPTDKWHDFEPFFSCTHHSFNDFDRNTQNHLKSTLCIYWATEGFKELYHLTNDIHYLQVGEQILARLSLFQQLWNMPYIGINTFGGFCSQNTDGELNDARQALFVRTYMEYYLETGKKDYMERGIAALRASWTLQLLQEYKSQCPKNIQNIPTLDTIDRGCIFENYGHTGKDEPVTRGYVEFDWGVGSAATAVAYTQYHFGDLFINCAQQQIWGLDSLLIHSYHFEHEKIKVQLSILREKREIWIKLYKNLGEIHQITINNSTYLVDSDEFHINTDIEWEIRRS